MNRKISVLILSAALLFIGWSDDLAYGEEPYDHAHTHIGSNQDQVWDGGDDEKLWFFSMPGAAGWPQWGEPLKLEPTGIVFEGKELYECHELDCWHSAHPEHGNWQLGGTDSQSGGPDWDIYLRRISFDEGFFMVDINENEILTADNDEYDLGFVWMDDKYNENGELGAWGIHIHTHFHAWAAGAGEIFQATFQAVDYGGTGYEASDNFTMTFITVPEPATLCLAVSGAGLLLGRRKSR